MKLMTAFHFFSFVEQEIARSDQIAELFKGLQDDLFTGIAELFEDDDRFVAIFAQGRLATFYHLGEKVERLDGKKWLAKIENSTGVMQARLLSLPVVDLRYFKIVIESVAQGREAETQEINPKSILEKLAAMPRSSITFGESSTLTFLYYCSGMDPDSSRCLIITPEKIENAAFDELLDALPQELKQTSVLSISASDPGDGWLEQQYHEVFARALKELLRVYGSMRERVYLNKVIRAINFKADANDLLILVNARDVNDQEIFDSPAKARKNYAALLAVAALPLRAELGENVYTESKNAIRSKCTDFQGELLEKLLLADEREI